MRYFDLHCDTPFEVYKRKISADDLTLSASLSKGNLFEAWKHCFAVWIRDDLPEPFKFYQDVLSHFKSEIKNKTPENLTPFFTVEGGAVLENDADRLYTLKNDGIKAMTLTWNGQNAIASGAKCEGGVTAFGRSVICKMNELNIACDLSHLNRESFFDAVKLAKFPLATHSCLNSVNQNIRNLDDSQVKALCEAGGIIGICFYPEFLGRGDVFENIYRNIYKMCDMGFEKNIALGSDFDGADMDACLDGVDKVPDLYEYLHLKGMDKELLDGIFYKNADKFFLKL